MRKVRKSEILNTENNKFNSGAILALWQASPRPDRCQANVKIFLLLKDRVIVASTCRRSVQFSCLQISVWIANCVSVMTEMVNFYKLTTSRRCQQAWTTSCVRCARLSVIG